MRNDFLPEDFFLNYGACNKPCYNPCYKPCSRVVSSPCQGGSNIDAAYRKTPCINNNPVINVTVQNGEGPVQPQPVQSSFLEVLGSTQTVATGGDVTFDAASMESVGNNMELDATGKIITITKPGMYHVEWNLNLAAATTTALAGIVENGQPASGSASSTAGNFASGTIIHVKTVPFTLTLRNYGAPMSIEDILPFGNSAASIRIVRFADGPSA